MESSSTLKEVNTSSTRVEPLSVRAKGRQATREDKENGEWNLEDVDLGWAPDDAVMTSWLQSTADIDKAAADVFLGEDAVEGLAEVDGSTSMGERTPSSSSIVVYDRDNAIEALNMLTDTSILSRNESKRIVKMLVKYVEHSDVQRKGMIEKEAVLRTQMAQQERELASLRQGFADERNASKGLKKTIDRLMQQQEESRADMNKMKMTLEFSKQKEQAAVAACKKASQQVEDVKRRASMKIDDAQKRLQELEVHMHLTGWQSDKNSDTRDVIVEPENIVTRVNKPDVVSEMKMSDEGKLLRSEMSLMQRKVDKSNTLLNKTTKAAQKLQEKLLHERQKVAGLQEERNQLQEQILKLHQKPQGLDPKQVGRLVHDLATARSKVEYLDREKTSLSEQLSLLQNEMSSISEDRRQALIKAELEAGKALSEEQKKCEILQAEMASLLQKLEDATESLKDYEATQASLEDSQKRCAELAGALDQEQMASYQRGMEIERLANAAQACAHELISLREELHHEKLKVQHLENENTGLSGRLEAFSEALSAQEHSSEVIESLAEGRAMFQNRLKQAESERDALRSKNAEFESRVAETEQYVQELEALLDSLHEDLSTSRNENNELETSLKLVKNDLDHSKSMNEELNSVIANLRESYNKSQETVSRLQKDLDETDLQVTKSQNEVQELSDQLRSSGSRIDQLCEDKNVLVQEKGKLEVEIEHLKLTMERLDQQVEDSKVKCVSLETSLKAAEIQCDALRKSNVEAQNDSLSMVDSMNEMSNLIEAVNVLQSRVHELQSSLASSQARASKLEDEKYALIKEVEIYEGHILNSQEKMADLRNTNEEIRAEHRQTVNRLDTVSKQLDALRKELELKVIENGEKQSHIVELLAMDASNTEEISLLQKRMEEMKRSLSHSHDKIASLQTEVDGCKLENEGLAEDKRNLQSLLEETQESLTACKGKLVVSSKRIERLEEATKHIDTLAKEFESLRSKHKRLIKQHALDKELFEDLSRRHDESVNQAKSHLSTIDGQNERIQALSSEVDIKNAMIDGLQESENSLKDEVTRLLSLEPQIELLKHHINEGGSWCDTAAKALEARAKELEASVMEANMARQDANALARQLAEAQEKAKVAEASLAIREASLAEEQDTRQAALETIEVLKEEIHVLSSQHKEMVDVIEAIKTAEEETVQKYKEACKLNESLKASIESLKSTIHGSDLEITKLNMSLEHLGETHARIVSENSSLKETTRELSTSLEFSTQKLLAAENKLQQSNETSQRLKQELEEASLSLTEKESQVESLQMEVGEYKSELAAHDKSSKVLQQQCIILENELEFLRKTLSTDSATSNQLNEVIKFVDDERAQLRSDISNLTLLVDGMRDEINQTREEAREVQSSKQELEEKLFKAMDENKTLSENVAILQKDMAVLEVVRDQLEKESMIERDESTRSKLYCKEAEREVLKLKNDYELFNQAMLGRLSAFEPVLQRILSCLEMKLHVEDNNNNGEDLINVPDVSGQSDKIIQSLNKIESYVAKLLGSLDTLNDVEQRCCQLTDSWASEKQAFKMIIRLALAIASDSLSGTDEASALFRKIDNNSTVVAVLKSSGLEHVWTSLSDLSQTKSGLKAFKKIRNLSSQLGEVKQQLERTSRKLSDEKQSSASLTKAIKTSCQYMAEITTSIENVTGDSKMPNMFAKDARPAEEIIVCVDTLKTSVNVMLRRYRSMARNISNPASRRAYTDLVEVDQGQLAKKDENSVRRNISTGSEKIPAVKL